jgi:hypothetical protein
MAEQYRRKALMDIFGDEEPDPLSPAPAPPSVPKPADLSADPASFTAGLSQRGGGTGGALGGALSGASLGATAGSILPGLGTGVGAAIGGLGGALKGLFTKKADTAPTDYTVPDATKAITDAYATYNGRPPAAGEVDQILAGQGLKPGDRFVGSGGLNSVLSTLQTNAKNAPPPVTAPVTPAVPDAPAGGGAPRPQTDTTLLEGDTQKLGNPAHIAKSPKYQFLSKFQGYSRGQENELLNQLKAEHGAHWNGWEFDGRGNFVFKGDPATLHPSWNGVTRVDAFGSYNAGGPLQARWGTDDGGTAQGATGGAGGALGGNPFGGEGLDDALNGDPLAAIRAAIAKFSGSRPNAAALMNQLGGG